MKYALLLTIPAMIALASCQPRAGNDTDTSGADTTAQVSTPAPIPGATCYQKIQNLDTFRLQVVLKDGRATGTLAYRFSQKDSSHGIIDGAMSGDTLFAIFDYASEGRRSKREVAFLLSPEDAVEGYGSLEQFGDTMRFISHKELQFGNLMRLQQIDCSGQPFDGFKAGE